MAIGELHKPAFHSKRAVFHLLGIKIMPANALSSVDIRATKTISPTVTSPRILHSSGKAPKNELLRLLKRAFAGKRKANFPSHLRPALISVRTPPAKNQSGLKNASPTDWASLFDQAAADVLGTPQAQHDTSGNNFHDVQSSAEDERAGPTGTFVAHEASDADSAMQAILNGPLDQNISEAEIAREKSQPLGPVSLTGPLGEAFAGIAQEASLKVFGKDMVRDASGQVLRRKSPTRNLPVHPQANSKTPEGAPAAKKEKAPAVQAAPDERPPSYDDAMSIPAVPRHYKLDEIQALETAQAPIAGEEHHPDLQRLDFENRLALLELARNLVPRFEGSTQDTLYKIVRELDKPKPELSRFAFDWMMDRARQLANNEVLVHKLQAEVQKIKAGVAAEPAKRSNGAVGSMPQSPATRDAEEVPAETQENDLSQQLAQAKVRLRKSPVAPAAKAGDETKPKGLAGALLERVDQQAPRNVSSPQEQQRDDDEWAV